MNIILFGPPGAGKGTQARKIVESFSLTHISTGDILREAVRSGSKLGRLAKQYMDRGELVPDDVMVEIVRHKVAEHGPSGGFVLDGFPRTIAQAEALDRVLGEEGIGIDTVISLEVDDDEILARISRRQELEKRKDDSLEVARNRLEVYRRETEPLKEYYRSRGMLSEIDGVGEIDEVFRRIELALSSKSK